jgi:hypothetical protein
VNAPVLTLTQAEREELNRLGTFLQRDPRGAVVDRALVICDHYAGREQLTICHEQLHARMLAEATLEATKNHPGQQVDMLMARTVLRDVIVPPAQDDASKSA